MAKVDMERLEQLERENKELKARAALIPALHSLDSEMQKINRLSNKTNVAGGIEHHFHTDHINISLWTKEGERIGPLHPDNAKATMLAFAQQGIYLTVNPPTGAEVEAYQQTEEYKELTKARQERRATKSRSKKSGQFDKLLSLMEKQYGLDKEALKGGMVAQR
jgi:hypothetical protein